MSKRVHIVPCDNGHGYWRIGFIIALFLGAWWLWDHVIKPIGHFLDVFLWWLGHVLMWSAIAIGGLSILCTVAFVVVCVVERRRHVRSSGTHRLARVPGRRLARKDASATIPLPYPAPNSSLSARAMNTDVPWWEQDGKPFLGDRSNTIEHLPPRKTDSLIKCEDDVFMLTHGIVPPDYENL